MKILKWVLTSVVALVMICANYSADHYCRCHEEYPEELPIRLCVFRKKTGAFSAPVLSKKIA